MTAGDGELPFVPVATATRSGSQLQIRRPFNAMNNCKVLLLCLAALSSCAAKWLSMPFLGMTLTGAAGRGPTPAVTRNMGAPRPPCDKLNRVEQRPEDSDRAEEAHLLADVGKAVRAQITDIEVHMSEELARRCVAAWEREDSSTIPADESGPEQITRHRAGVAALIGLAIKERGLRRGDRVVVTLDMGLVGAAVQAADEDK